MYVSQFHNYGVLYDRLPSSSVVPSEKLLPVESSRIDHVEVTYQILWSVIVQHPILTKSRHVRYWMLGSAVSRLSVGLWEWFLGLNSLWWGCRYTLLRSPILTRNRNTTEDLAFRSKLQYNTSVWWEQINKEKKNGEREAARVIVTSEYKARNWERKTEIIHLSYWDWFSIIWFQTNHPTTRNTWMDKVNALYVWKLTTCQIL